MSGMGCAAAPARGRPDLTQAFVVYAAGLVQGLTLVSFPALSSVLKQMHGLTDAQYGAIFLPQVSAAVIGALAGAALSHSMSLQRLLSLALLCNLLSQLALTCSAGCGGADGYMLVLLGTTCLGLGFGLGGAPLNGLPPRLFPRRAGMAVLGVHTALGLGLTAGAPLASWLASAGRWDGLPLLACACAAALALGAWSLPALASETQVKSSASVRPASDVAFWVFVLVAVLYAFAEGTFANWAVIYLKEVKQLPLAAAAWALSVFWGALVLGRLLCTGLLARMPAMVLWASLPPTMLVAFLLLPLAHGTTQSIAVFALAGLACSAFLPITKDPPPTPNMSAAVSMDATHAE